MASRECILKSLLILQTVIDFEILERTEHPDIGLIPGTLDTWFNDLAGLSDEQVTVAFSHFRRTLTSDFNRRPRPGDVIQFCERIQTGGWLAGWREYLERAEASGMFGSSQDAREWSSPLVQAAAEACGGIRALAAADVSKHPFLKKQFQDAYQAASDAVQAQHTLQALGCPQIGQRAEVIQIAEARARRQDPEEELKCPHSDPAQAIEWLKGLRRRQMGDGPLPDQEKPIVVDRSQPLGFTSLGTAIKKWEKHNKLEAQG
jgi:ribosome modulation factor